MVDTQSDGSGRIFVVWHDCRFQPACRANDVVLSTSTDGLIWTPVTRVPIGDTSGAVDRFIPGLGVDRTTAGTTARLGLAYHYYPQSDCTASTCQIVVAYISSGDGGVTWSAPVDLAGPMALTSLPATSQGPMVGDNVSTSFAGGTAHPVFVVARPPAGGFSDVAMYSPVTGLAAVAGAPVVGASTAEAPASAAAPVPGPAPAPANQTRR